MAMPGHLASHPTLNEQYVSPADIARMVMKQYCGWWDDIPSHWAPARFDQQAAAVCELAGGADAVVERARQLVDSGPAIAAHLVDWAWFANEGDVAAVFEIYTARITAGRSNTQQVLMYLDHMTDVRLAMDAPSRDASG